MTFKEKLQAAWRKNNSLVCVGLDPDRARMPEPVRGAPTPLLTFGRAIVDATHDIVCAYKPQIAYYAAEGAEDELAQTIAHIREVAPGIPVILDAKRGDIGSTAQRYAIEAFDRYGADAVTVNPYMGGDTLKPFLDRTDRGVIVLCRTSNPGAAELQQLPCGGKPLYQHVAHLAAHAWNANDNIMLVLGATAPHELAEIRQLCPTTPFLVPGVGAQGGDVEQVVRAGVWHDRTGLVINSSRAIIYAGQGSDYAARARDAAASLRDQINRYR